MIFFFVSIGIDPLELNHLKTKGKIYFDLNTKRIIPIVKIIMNFEIVEINAHMNKIKNRVNSSEDL